MPSAKPDSHTTKLSAHLPRPSVSPISLLFVLIFFAETFSQDNILHFLSSLAPDCQDPLGVSFSSFHVDTPRNVEPSTRFPLVRM